MSRRLSRTLLLLSLLTPAATIAPACQGRASRSASDAGARRADMEWWREARFGLFLHWGLYAIPAGKWVARDDYGEWILNSAQIPVEEYEGLQARWDPVHFDADAWVRMAKDAGMRYLVVTTKHHDGFGLWDSAVSEWDVGGTPSRRDVIAELADACRRGGLGLGFYHSILDWHHPDYLPRRGWEQRPSEGADFERYVAYLHAQVTELLTRYGKVDVMWFDGEWEGTWTHAHGQALYDLCKRLQPDVIVNNRVDKGRGGMAGLTTDARFAGDFGTPEQEVPATGLPGVDWESCMTMNSHWGWNAADRRWKSAPELVRILCDVASKGGNLLLNVGPRADGTFPPEAVERLAAIGAWMDVHAEAIRGTEASPFGALPYGRCTLRRERGGSTLYLHVFDWPADGRFTLPAMGNRVRSARVLGAQARAAVTPSSDGRTRLDFGRAAPEGALVPVIAVALDGAPVPFSAPTIAAESQRFVSATTVTLGSTSDDLVVRYTLDGSAPDEDSDRARGPLRLRDTTTVRARSFFEGRAVGDETQRRFERVAPNPAVADEGSVPGVHVALFRGRFERIPDLRALTPWTMYTARSLALTDDARAEDRCLHISGFLEVPQTELWRFRLTSDDGSRLWIDGQLVVDNDGLHGAESREGDAPLAAGLHTLQLEWFNASGDAALELEWALPGAPFEPVPAERLRRTDK